MRLKGCLLPVLAASALGIFLVIGVGKAQADPVLDQSNPGPFSNAPFINSSQSVWHQSFTVGISGTLDSIDVLVSKRNTPNAPLKLAIRDSLFGADLAFASLDQSVIGSSASLINFDISAFALNVEVGEQYFIFLSSSATDPSNQFHGYNWFHSLDDTYGGGMFFAFNNPNPDRDFGFQTFVDSVKKIDIDIKPGSFPNSINLGSGGATPVAILGSATLDVNDIDRDTLTLGTSGIKTVGKKDRQLCSIDDVSGDFTGGLEGAPDGFADLVCHFITVDVVPEAGDTEAKLSGNLLATAGGTPIEGSDFVNIVP